MEGRCPLKTTIEGMRKRAPVWVLSLLLWGWIAGHDLAAISLYAK